MLSAKSVAWCIYTAAVWAVVYSFSHRYCVLLFPYKDFPSVPFLSPRQKTVLIYVCCLT